MSPVAQGGETNFSPCSLGNICRLQTLSFSQTSLNRFPSLGSLMQGISGGKTNTSCLADPDTNRQIISLQMCGNGIVETGEDCDPGQGVNSTCCDTSTCKFRNGAVCDPDSSTCCTDQCSFAPSTQVCRPSKDPKCDTAENCTGNSSSCPADKFSPNGQFLVLLHRLLTNFNQGQSCGNNNLKCASGQCTSVAREHHLAAHFINLTPPSAMSVTRLLYEPHSGMPKSKRRFL